MNLSTLIALGRVSNLPTVWTNVIAALVLSGARVDAMLALGSALALSFFYTGGMYLNDAFDHRIDARERPERPIPSGKVRASTVYAAGFAQLGLGTALVCGLALGRGQDLLLPLASALGLGAVIVLYDAFHKGNPLSPLLMGLCRVGVYVTVALLAVGALPEPVLEGAAVLLAYLIGLTYVAKQENLAKVTSWWPLLFLLAPFAYTVWRRPPELLGWVFALLLLLVVVRALAVLLARRPRIPVAVVTFIAGIALVDALLVALAGSYLLAMVCVLGFGFTLMLQRWVRGT